MAKNLTYGSVIPRKSIVPSVVSKIHGFFGAGVGAGVGTSGHACLALMLK
jgi:hypothetical protein